MGRADSPLADRVIFVEGAPRSGTTWLVNLLAMHREVAGVEAESHLFDFGVDRLFDNIEGRDPRYRGLQSYLERDELVDLARDLCDGVLMAMRSHVSGDDEPTFVVEKTPVGARQDRLELQRKRDCYPDAWYIHIVRDQEAVIRSLMRAPFMVDQSRGACAAIWEGDVAHIRGCLGDLGRYREISYEHLRDDPTAACRDLFYWLDIQAEERDLALVRTVSQERFSDLGAVPPSAGRSARALLDRMRERGRAVLGHQAVPPDDFAFTLARALRERDESTLASLMHPAAEFIHRNPDGDVLVDGEDARAALIRLARETFDRGYVGEWWASSGAGTGEWWAASPGLPFCSVFFSGWAGNAARADIALGARLEHGQIRRLVVISAGPFSGRPIVAPT